MNPSLLPVYQQREKILAALADHQVIVVESPTGSGKTTQIPLILHEAGYSRRGIVGVTQPRRIAALSVSDFIARQIGTKIPDTVGYTMRFEDRTDDSTVIKIMTDGILLQELKGDRLLSRYSVLMVDEAHERSLNIDFILGMLKGILAQRPELRVIVSSATINVEVFSEYFDGCPVVSIDAPMYPVELVHAPPKIEGDQESLLAGIREIVDRIMRKGTPGDILIFLQGELAIKNCVQLIAEMDPEERLALIPLYARLAHEDQAKVFLEYPGKRKVIVATNIAETSVTIDGVVHVIDSGLAKMNFYSPKTFTESLIEVPVSKASCNQRRGRAGRTAPGVCYRLYTHKDYESRPLYTTEEILRTDLSEVVLRMAELGIRDFDSFDFLSPPGQEGMRAAVETLRLLDALGEERELTETGRLMCLFPILPKHARMIVEAIRAYPSVIEEVIVAATFLSVNSPFLLPAGEELEARRAHHSFRDPLGDFVSYQRIFEAFLKSSNRARFCDSHYLDLRTMNEIANIKVQLEEIVSSLGVPIGSGGSWEDYLCAISRGLIQFVCERTGRGIYRSLTADKIQIHPGSLMFRESPPYIVAGEIVRTTRMYARSVSPLRKQLLSAISPLLTQAFVKGVPLTRERELEKKRDFTNQMKIGPEVFPIRTIKGGRKLVTMEWDKLRRVLQQQAPGTLSSFRNLYGTIVWDGKEIFSGMKLSVIMTLAPYLHTEEGVWEDWPAGRNFSVAKDAGELCSLFPRLLCLCPLKNMSKRLGFLTLYTDWKGSYWFKAEKSLLTARQETLASLESIADEPGDLLSREDRESAARLYHLISEMLEE
ncbi:MAG TPA: ATP-dependent RNA helicase [Spirochaetia bacterium]|nr:ATP-dependent RNA helicase [Spirochaetia bacterium]